MVSEVGINPQSLLYGFLNEVMDHPCSDGVLEVLGSNVPNFIKDVPNFVKVVKDVPNFVKDVPRVPECVLRWGSTSNHFLVDSKMKLWTIHVQMGVLKVLGSDVPNFVKNVPIF